MNHRDVPSYKKALVPMWRGGFALLRGAELELVADAEEVILVGMLVMCKNL